MFDLEVSRIFHEVACFILHFLKNCVKLNFSRYRQRQRMQLGLVTVVQHDDAVMLDTFWLVRDSATYSFPIRSLPRHFNSQDDRISRTCRCILDILEEQATGGKKSSKNTGWTIHQPHHHENRCIPLARCF